MSVLLGNSGASVILGSSGGGVVRTTGAKALLTSADFTYLGMFRVPPYAFYPSATLSALDQANTAYSYYGVGLAPFASRVVGGERRFFVACRGQSQGNQILEIALPTDALTSDPTTAPIAETRDFWYGTSGDGGVYGPSSARKFSRSWPTGGSGEVVTCGLLWDESRQVLWWTIGEVFQTSATGSPVLGYAKLTTPTGSASTPASATAYGPFHVDTTISNHTTKGMIIELPSELQGYVGGRRLGMGGALFHSILGPHDFGPAIVAIDEPTDSTNPVVSAGSYPFSSLGDTITYADVLRYGNGGPGGLDSHGNYEYLSRMHKANDYRLLGWPNPDDYAPPNSAAGGTSVNPVGSTGWWTHLDVTTGAVWIDNATKQGMLFTGGYQSGSTWYTTSGYVPHDWRTGDPQPGEAVPAMFDHGERLRIGSESYNPCFYLLSLNDMVTGATLGYGHYAQDCTKILHDKQFPAAAEGAVSFPHSAPVYDPTTRRLYVLQSPGWTSGTERKPLVHVWEVAD